jgi:hypothetical protein
MIRLRFPLPVGYVYSDEPASVVLDPDVEVQNAVRLVFSLFRQTGSAYGVVRHFTENNLSFPRRAYGGVWDGKIIWGKLHHEGPAPETDPAGAVITLSGLVWELSHQIAAAVREAVAKDPVAYALRLQTPQELEIYYFMEKTSRQRLISSSLSA